MPPIAALAISSPLPATAFAPPAIRTIRGEVPPPGVLRHTLQPLMEASSPRIMPLAYRHGTPAMPRRTRHGSKLATVVLQAAVNGRSYPVGPGQPMDVRDGARNVPERIDQCVVFLDDLQCIRVQGRNRDLNDPVRCADSGRFNVQHYNGNVGLRPQRSQNYLETTLAWISDDH